MDPRYVKLFTRLYYRTSKRLLDALELRYGSTELLQDEDKKKGLLNLIEAEEAMEN